MTDHNEIAEHLLQHDPEDTGNEEFVESPYQHWQVLLEKGLLQERPLEPGRADNFLPLSHKKNTQLRKQWQYKYYDDTERTQTIDIGALAHLQLGRAFAMQGDTAKAKAAYQDFLTLWKDADPDIPILKQAKEEYAKLQ
jgi:hypothetical protein